MNFNLLQANFSGELYFQDSGIDHAQRLIYATDASVYQEKPVAVALPKTVQDIRTLIAFAHENKQTLIPRAAGTSLAGQVVGKGIVVDISKHFNKIIEVNAQEKWVRVQPGVIRDDLNKHLAPFGLMFGPETSTANRAMIGGMVGNNSCGLHSIVWGAARDHLMEATGVLSDGKEAHFSTISDTELAEKCRAEGGNFTRENLIYRGLSEILMVQQNQELIRKHFPKKTVTRRNTGYALDALLESSPFTDTWQQFNLCKLLAGSEGTLAFLTELKLNLIDLPPKENGLLCIHCHSLDESLRANLVAMNHKPFASELVDKYILDFTLQSTEYRPNRFFIEGDPEAILMVESFADTKEEIRQWADALVLNLKEKGLGYAYPLLFDNDAKKAWDVRKGGLGLLRNMPGDTQPVNLIEDCAVAVEDLPHYIADLQKLLALHDVRASYYAHAGAGELHVEPMINLKTKRGKDKFKNILEETAVLVKKYKGSLSGEHGDGRLRGELIPFMMGREVYTLFQRVKDIFDPEGVFNAGKIVDTPPMNEFLRYEADRIAPKIDTIFDFSKQEGILRLTEKCSGSGDCKKSHLSGGTMCPSFMATRLEKDSTRARANILRQYLDQPQAGLGQEAKEVLDLCLSCKACKSECPSGVDVAKLKAEFTQQYYNTHGVPFRAKLVGNYTKANAFASVFWWGYNAIYATKPLRALANRMVGFHPKRSMPLLSNTTLKKWFEQYKKKQSTSADKDLLQKGKRRKILLFADEFSNYNDVAVGQKAVWLFEKLGYEVAIPEHIESGRTYLSKGLLKEAREVAIKNVNLLYEAVKGGIPIVGIEPSAILTLRDEYLELVPPMLRPAAEKVAENTYLFEEYFAQEIGKKRIKSEQFSTEKRLIKLHGHCHQKALSSLTPVKKSLSLPANYEVHLIPSGCCGMAGSFGYEAEHYEVSMQIGELVLFPTIRQQAPEVLIAAPGTSCRHQIKDGTGRAAQHPIEILWEAVLK